MAKQYLTKGGFTSDIVNGTYLVPKDGFNRSLVAFNGGGSGNVGDIQLNAIAGIATVSDTGSGSIADIQLTAAAGTVNIGKDASGSIADIQLTAIGGTFAISETSSGSVGDIQLSAITGSASTSTSGNGTGSIADIQLSAITGSATLSPNAHGSIADIQLSPIRGMADGGTSAGTGSIEDVQLFPIRGNAVISFSVHKSIIWQYDTSPALNSIIHSFEPPLDGAALLSNFVNKIWDVRTANSQGLDILGRIVGVSRYLSVPATGYFGFEPDYTPFDDKPFFHGSAINDQFKLSNDLYRKVILTKALNNISGSSIPELERSLNLLFGDKGVVKVKITGFSQLTYEFHFTPEPIDSAIIATPGLIPQPAGHKIIKVFV